VTIAALASKSVAKAALDPDGVEPTLARHAQPLCGRSPLPPSIVERPPSLAPPSFEGAGPPSGAALPLATH
jgi:hypothetical protein